MHPATSQAIQEIDAAFFSGDTFHDADNLEHIAEYVARWGRAVNARRNEIQLHWPSTRVELGDEADHHTEYKRTINGMELTVLEYDDGDVFWWHANLDPDCDDWIEAASEEEAKLAAEKYATEQ